MADVQANSRPTVDDLTGDNHYAQLARKHWLNKTKQPKVQRDVIEKELWAPLGQEDFSSLLLLEQLQLLELYL